MPPAARRLGIIDLGSNSARLLVAEYTPGHSFRFVAALSRRVRLSEGMGAGNVLSAAAIARAVEALARFRRYCEAHGARIVAVATAAARDAVNRREFLAQARAVAGVRLQVLGGEDEAQLGSLAVMNGLGMRDGIVLDVGGGSAEVSRLSRGRFVRGVALPLGAVRLTESHLSQADPVRQVDAVRLEAHIGETLDAVPWMRLGRGARLAGVGGTVRALAAIDRLDRGYPLELGHGYELERSRLDRLIGRLRALPVSKRAQAVPGLPSDRADIILAGAMVVAAAMRRAGADRLWVCRDGLREGIFYREFLRPAQPPVFDNLREFSVLNLARRHGGDTPEAARTAETALGLFDALRATGKFGLGAAEREWLWAAARLCAIGRAVDHMDEGRHASFLILSSGLPGYSHRELALVALACRFASAGTPELGAHDHLCAAGDAGRLLRLAALLRVAAGLASGATPASRPGLRVRVTADSVRVGTQAGAGAHGRAAWQASPAFINDDLFTRVFGRAIEVQTEG